MRKSLTFALSLLAALAAAGCPATTTTTTTPPPVDVRAVQLAQVPDETEFVVQADLARVVEPAVIERWIGRMLQLGRADLDPACAIALLARAQILTGAMLRVDALDEEAMLLVSGDLAAADVAACVAQLLGAEPPQPSAEGVYEFSSRREQMQIADLATGGVVLASPAALPLARGPAPAAEASLVGAPAYQQLRALLGAGPNDLEAYMTRPTALGDFGFQGAGVVLQRGTADRYEVVILAGDADGANAIAMFVATLPLLIAGFEAQLDAAAETAADPPLAAETMAEARGVVAAVREALTVAQTTVEGDAVRVVLELDPSRASPVQLLVVSGMWLWVRGARDVRESIEQDVAPVLAVPDEPVGESPPPVE